MLSAEDKAALADNLRGVLFWGTHSDRWNDAVWQERFWATGAESVATTVEQIVARHVAVALTEAADAIAFNGDTCTSAHGKGCIGSIAYRDSERIVRNLAAKPT